MKKQVWLITGTSSGIGKVLVEELLNAEQLVVATARNPFALTFSAEPKQLLTIGLDINLPEQIQQVVPQVLSVFGRIDVLVNNAGYGLEGAVEELTMEQIRHQLETNFFGLVDLTRQVIPVMRKQKSGYIVNVSSLAGLRGFKGLSIYNASKFAVEGFSEAISQELEPFGIRVSV
ncbi:MAG: SDR family oxidoreductase, partial [Bacteroidia bacterium]|nr:SDR family oxidoreductase [Bacteroidia bacterium]